MNEAVRARFMAKVEKALECWTWTAAVDRDGYGVFYLDGKNPRAHRVSLMLQGIVIPTGMVVDHICRNRACVNPDHLRVVDRLTNVHENSAAPGHLNSLKTHCVRGHEYAGSNLRLRPNGSRMCLACKAQSNREGAKRRQRSRPAREPSPRPNSLKTHCPYGHEFAGSNLILRQNRRYCREMPSASAARISTAETNCQEGARPIGAWRRSRRARSRKGSAQRLRPPSKYRRQDMTDKPLLPVVAWADPQDVSEDRFTLYGASHRWHVEHDGTRYTMALADHATALASLTQSQERIEALERDARRYRWLRDAPATWQDDRGIRQWLFARPFSAQTLDAAIDAALSPSEPGA